MSIKFIELILTEKALTKGLIKFSHFTGNNHSIKQFFQHCPVFTPGASGFYPKLWGKNRTHTSLNFTRSVIFLSKNCNSALRTKIGCVCVKKSVSNYKRIKSHDKRKLKNVRFLPQLTINVNFAFLYTAIAVYTKRQEFKIQQKMGWFS